MDLMWVLSQLVPWLLLLLFKAEQVLRPCNSFSVFHDER